MGITTKSFGKTKKGEEAKLYILENKNGMKAVFSDFGAVLVELWVPDKNGKLEDVVLGFDTLAEYEANPTYFGSFIGRCGNRIGGAKFTIDGKEYEVSKVLGKDKESDLVVIKVDIEKSKPVKIANRNMVKTGDKVYAIGYPQAFKVGIENSTFTDGIVSKNSFFIPSTKKTTEPL